MSLTGCVDCQSICPELVTNQSVDTATASPAGVRTLTLYRYLKSHQKQRPFFKKKLRFSGAILHYVCIFDEKPERSWHLYCN